MGYQFPLEAEPTRLDGRHAEAFGIEYRDGEPVILRLGSTATTELVKQVEQSIDRKAKDARGDTIDTDPRRQRMEEMARNFVESTVGIRPEAEVYWRQQHTNGTRGIHIDNRIYMSAQDDTSDDDLKFIREATVLVHELAHNARENSRIVLHKTTEPLRWHSPTAPRFPTSMVIPKYSKSYKKYTLTTEGDFFEEAFANETAARWVDSFTRVSEQRPSASCRVGNVTIPLRHTLIGKAESDSAPTSISLGTPAYASHALSLLSQASETNLYDLMIQMRKSATKAKAKQQFIKAVNSIQPDLYRKLRSLPYTADDFYEGVESVDRSISPEKYISRSLFAGRLLGTIKSLLKA